MEPLKGKITSELFRRPSISDILEQVSGTRKDLYRHLRTPDLVIMGIGTMIGVGIFVITGIAAGQYAGPAIIISFLIAALTCLMAAFSYAEFASIVPITGSAYTYGYVSLGEIIAWIIGWDLILEYLVDAATVSIGWSEYALTLLSDTGYSVPAHLSHSVFVSGGLINLPAVIIILLLTGVIWYGVKETARLAWAVVGIKLVIIAFFLIIAIPTIDTAHFHPFMPFGWGGVMSGAAIIFFAFIGFDALTTTSEEVINPQKTLPRAILVTLILVTVLYLVVATTLVGMVPYQELGKTAAPLILALTETGNGWAAPIISAGAIAGITSVILVYLYGQSRILYAMSCDGLIPAFFSQVDSKHHSPEKSLLISGVAGAILAGFLPIEILAEMTNIGTLAAYCVVSASVIILRKTQKDLVRPFRCPFVPWIPLLGIILCGYLIISLSFGTWLRFVVWLGIGLLIYWVYGRKHSLLRRRDESGRDSDLLGG